LCAERGSCTTTAGLAAELPWLLPAMSTPMLFKSLEIKNRLGLHARAAAQLVQVATKFEADITVTKDGQVVDGKSILGLMMLAAGPGSYIDVNVSGPQAAEALAAIEQLVDQKFNEE
jgi:phosphocarrier protein HPr